MAAAGAVRGVSGVLYAEGDRRHPDEPHPHHRGAGSEHLAAGHLSAAVRDVPRGKEYARSSQLDRENQLLAVESRRYMELRSYLNRPATCGTISASTCM